MKSPARQFTRLLLCLVLCCPCVYGPAQSLTQPEDSIRILVIYGSRPAKGYPKQYKWFGGRAGGHVAIQIGPHKVLSFRSTKYVPWCHIRPRWQPRHFRSTFDLTDPESVWQTFNYYDDRDYDTATVKHLIVTIPITPVQRRKLDSISNAYLSFTPYDYAVLGMRCASATYEIMAQLGLFHRPFRHAVWLHLLYPRALRYYVLNELRHRNGDHPWRLYLSGASPERIWDYDWKLK